MTLRTAEPNTVTKGTPGKILIAEDFEYLREAISEALEDEGHEIHMAVDGYEAVKIFEEQEFDLAILDMRMPMMDGKDVCAVLRRSSDIPIIMFTSNDDADNVQEAIEKGATDFVLKTTGIPELIDRLERHLEEYRDSKSRDETLSLVDLSDVEDEEEEDSQPEKESKTLNFVIQGSNFEFEQGRVKSTTLIVDPDQQSRSDIITVLSRLNQNYVELETAEQAIDAVNTFNFDMMIVEWALPDIDAFRMLTELQSLRRYHTMSKMVMSTRINPEAQRKLEFAGVEHVLRKPLDRGQLEVVVGDEVKKILNNLRAKKEQGN